MKPAVATSPTSGMTAPTRKARPIYTYDIPESARSDEWQTVGLVEVTTNEERSVVKKAKRAEELGYALMQIALVQVNGQTINRTNGDMEQLWSDMPYTIRRCVMEAYNDIHTPKTKDVRGFLKSRKVTVG